MLGFAVVPAGLDTSLAAIAAPTDENDELNTSLRLDSGSGTAAPVSLLGSSGVRKRLQERCTVVCPQGLVPALLTVQGDVVSLDVDDGDARYRSADGDAQDWMRGFAGRWLAEELRVVALRRYLLRPVAVELFFLCGVSVFLAFEDKQTARAAARAIPVPAKHAQYGVSANTWSSVSRPRELVKRSGVTQRWRAGHMSNFDYLMFLNTAAGRTFNDLGQYFIMPWVICQFTGETLDLEDPSNYRDMSRPVGAQDEVRRAALVERYEDWDTEETGMPPFHYGSHYSTPGYTLWWLMRLEPFTRLFLEMQGGQFDHPDRAFSSMARAWANCTASSTDNRELIPEVFYLPDMFYNRNRYGNDVAT